MCLYCAPEYLLLSFVLYIEVIDKTWCEYKSIQTMDYAVNLGLITSNKSAIKAVLTQCLTMAS